MAAITASMVKELRDRTQAGMADCKNALVESDGDMEKAVEVILKKGIVKAASRAGRIAAEGEVATWIAPDGKKRRHRRDQLQTDFVSRGDDFKGLVKSVVEVASKAPEGERPGDPQVPRDRQDGGRRAGRAGREDRREHSSSAAGPGSRPRSRTASCTRTCTRAASSRCSFTRRARRRTRSSRASSTTSRCRSRR